jgi:hypothetical protein
VPKRPKQATYDQVLRKQDKAVQFLRDVVGNDDLANDIEDLSVQEYADKKNIEIVNPNRSTSMANGNGRTKQDLLDEINDLTLENQDLSDQLDAINDILNPPEDGDQDLDDDDDYAS